MLAKQARFCHNCTTDETSSMTGRVQRGLKCFQKVRLAGFFCILCANNQLELLIKTLMKSVIRNFFDQILFYLFDIP